MSSNYTHRQFDHQQQSRQQVYSAKLDLLLSKLTDMERRWDVSKLRAARWIRPPDEFPYEFPAQDKRDYDDFRRRWPPTYGQRRCNPPARFRDQYIDKRDQRGRYGSDYRDFSHRYADQYVQHDYTTRQPSCWDPPDARSPRRNQAYDENVDVGYMRQHIHEETCFMTHDMNSSRGIEKRVGYGCISNIEPGHHPWQPDRTLTTPDRTRHQQARQPSCRQAPSLCRSAAPPLAAAAPSPPLRSDRPQKQPDTASTIEQPPYAAPRACQPLQSLPVSAPFLASTHHPLAGVSSSRKEEWETHLHDGEEKREDKLTELNSVWNQQEKVSDSTAKREEEVNKNFPKLIEKETKAEALRASLETKEKDLSVLPEQKSTNEKMEIQCIVEEHKPAFGIQKHDLEVEMEEKRRLFEGDVGVKTTELVTKKSAISQKILKKGGQTYVFDPGGDTSPKCVLSTLFAASWCCGFHLEDKVDFNRGGVDTRHIFFISHYYYLVSL